MARELNRELAADDIVAYDEVGRIRAAIGVMISSNQQIRPQMFERTAAAWRDRIPTTGRLKLEIELKQKSLSIRELRIVASDSRFSEWETDRTEPGIGLFAISFAVTQMKFRYDRVALASVGQHGLGRWF